jgi:hypothetical protein
MRSLISLLTLLTLSVGQADVNVAGGPEPDVERMPYEDNGFNLTGFVAKPVSASVDFKVPALIIIP